MFATYIKHAHRLFQCSKRLSTPTQVLNNVSRMLSNVTPTANNLQTAQISENNPPVEDCDVFGNMEVSLESKRQKTIVPSIPKTASYRPRNNKKDYKRRSFKKQVDEADKFGNLSDENPFFYSEDLNDKYIEPDYDSRIEYPVEKKFTNAHAYLNEMKRLVGEKKLKEALELIPDMYKNRVLPFVSNYTFLIGACGQAGYTEMAFKLLRQMTDRGFRPTCAVLTGLFNSCAECPFPDYGLKKAAKLREKIMEKNWSMNQTSYHAMIKAFGKCGDIGTAFEIVDEMIKEDIAVTAATYNFLLMACIADKDAGFTHSIEVWRKMMSKAIPPHLYTFNLLLRAVRDCGVGPEEISCILLQHWSSYRKRPYGLNAPMSKDDVNILKLPNPEFSDTKLLSPPEDIKSDTIKSFDEDAVKQDTSSEIYSLSKQEASFSIDVNEICTNILMERPSQGLEFIQLSNITTSSDRLALVGNASGYLQLMQNHKVKPDIKTFTLLLENLPQTTQSEKELLDLLYKYKVHADTDFFNILIKRRNVRHDFMAAKNVLLLLNKHNLSPDIVTFGVLALGCRNAKLSNLLLRDMKNFGVTPNVEIVGALIHSACKAMDFDYLSNIMKIMRVESIFPNERILNKIENTMEEAHESILKKEQGQPMEEFFDENFSKKFQAFKSYYADWLHLMKMVVEDHPWDQYRADINLHKKETDKNFPHQTQYISEN